MGITTKTVGIMEKSNKARYDATFNSFMELYSVQFESFTIIFNIIFWKVMELKVRFVHFEENVSAASSISLLKPTKKIIFLTKFVQKLAKNIHKSLNRTVCSYSVTKTVQTTSNCTRVCVFKLRTTKISWQVRLTFLLNRFSHDSTQINNTNCLFYISEDLDQIQTIRWAYALGLL